MFQKKTAVAIEPDDDDQPPGRTPPRGAVVKKKGKKPPTRVAPQWAKISDQMLAARPGAR
jgi:hypothetical protein